MNRTRSVLLIVAAGTLVLAGCAENPPYAIGAPVLDSHFGEAVKRSMAMQVIHADGAAVEDRSYSGKAAQMTMERHDAGLTRQAPTASASPPEGSRNSKESK